MRGEPGWMKVGDKAVMNVISVLLACCLVSCGPGASAMAPVASAIEDVPVPRSAERNDTGLSFVVSGSATEMAWLRAERQATYVVPDISSEQLLAWYAEHMPAGQPWQEWAWCERPSQLFQRSYHLPGTNRTLALLVPRGERASVLIVQHEGTGC
jgi:hypothetical protein